MTRVVTAAVFLPVLLAVLGWGPPWAFAALVAVTVGLGTRELSGLAARSGIRLPGWIPMLVGILACGAFLDPATAGERILLLLAAGGAGALLLVLVRPEDRAIDSAAATVFACIYPGVMLGFLVGLRTATAPDGRRLLLFLLLVIWASDVAAYYLGRAFGRRPLAPRISPKKTVEGGIGGLLAAAAVAAGCYHFFLPEIGPSAPLVGVGLAGVGILGDLVESTLKRGAGVKDTSGILPGHGGILDRLDSLLLAAPVFYYYHLFVMR